jgi:hypothetical protein
MDDTATTVAQGSQSRAGVVTMNKKSILLLIAGCLIAGYLVANSTGFSPLNPFAPHKDRPVLRLITRLAKFGLWVAVFAEPQSVQRGPYYARAYTEKELVCHAEGW